MVLGTLLSQEQIKINLKTGRARPFAHLSFFFYAFTILHQLGKSLSACYKITHINIALKRSSHEIFLSI